MLRLSAATYNTLEDYEHLAHALMTHAALFGVQAVEQHVAKPLM